MIIQTLSQKVCAMFRAGDIRGNVLLKFIRLCMETPCLCPHKCGGRKLTKTYVTEVCYKKPVVIFWELINIFLSTYSRTRTVQTAKSHFFNVTAFSTAILYRIAQKLRNSTLLYHKTKNPTIWLLYHQEKYFLYAIFMNTKQRVRVILWQICFMHNSAFPPQKKAF